MNCSPELVLDYSAGRLDAARRAELDAHVKSCSACENALAEQAAMWSALDAWEPAPVSADFNRNLWRKIDAANAAAPWYAKLRLWKSSMPLAAAAAVVVFGFVLDHRSTITVPVTVSSVEAEQAERTLDDIQMLRQLDGSGG